MWNIIYLCTGFALIFLLVIIYKSKPKVKSKEIVIFERLIIINLIGYVVEIILQLLMSGHLNGFPDLPLIALLSFLFESRQSPLVTF